MIFDIKIDISSKTIDDTRVPSITLLISRTFIYAFYASCFHQWEIHLKITFLRKNPMEIWLSLRAVLILVIYCLIDYLILANILPAMSCSNFAKSNNAH